MPWSRRFKNYTITIRPNPSLLEKTTKIEELFRIYKENVRGRLSEHTLDIREAGVRRIISQMRIDDVKLIDRKCLTSFKNALLDSGITKATINTYLSNINLFLQYFGINIDVPYLSNRKGREAKIVRSILKSEEIERLLEVIPSVRYKAAVAILVENGFRIGTKSSKKGYPRRGLLGLNWGDVDFENGTVRVIGKGGKEYTRPLGKLSERYLKELKETGNMGKIGPKDPVFVSNRGRRLSYWTFYLTLRKYMERADIPKEKRHPHAFRHTTGTFVTKKYGIRAAKGVLCHENLASTLIYEHISDEEYLKELFRPDKVQKVADEEVKMKVCPKCDAELTPDRKLCVCGYDFTLHRCPKCGRSVEEDAKFCPIVV